MTGGSGWYYGYLVEGDKVTYEFSITNTGDEIGDVQITDIIPEGTILVSANSDFTTDINSDAHITIDGTEKKAVIWNFSNVPPKETVTGTITLKIAEDADYTVINNIYKNTEYSKVESSSMELPVKPKLPDLEITKTAESSGGKYSNPGDIITYTITVKNKGAEDIITSIIDELPEELESISCSNQENAIIENGIITWNNVEIGVGQTVTFTVIGTVKEGTDGTITNFAIVDKDGEYEKTASVSTDVFDEGVAIGNTELSKESNKTYVNTGDTVVYTIQLKNTGKDYNIEDIAGGKITTTDIIPEGLSYEGGAYYLLPNNSIEHSEGISFDEVSKTLTWDLESTVYNTFTSNSVVTLYIPCKIVVEALESEDISIDNKVNSSTLDKESNVVTINVLKSEGLKIEKYVHEVYDNVNKDNLLYENKSKNNSEEVNIDFEENYLVCYKAKISNTSNEDIVLDSNNGVFHDIATGLIGIDGNVSIIVSNSQGEKLEKIESYINHDWNLNAEKFDIDLSGYTIYANDYIILTYELKGVDVDKDLTKATNKITNNVIESTAQELVNRPDLNKSVAIVDKNASIGNSQSDLLSYLLNLEFNDNINIVASNLQNKYLLYKVHLETEGDKIDTFTITDTISNYLNYVTDATNYVYAPYSCPVIALVYSDKYEWSSERTDYITWNSPKTVIDGKQLTITFDVTDGNVVDREFDIYYLVEIDNEKLQSMLSDIENGIDIDVLNLKNTVNVKSNKIDENNKPIIDLSDSSDVNVNDGVLYPGIEKEYSGFFASGDTKLDEDGNIVLSNGSANAGANLVWKITVKNEDKDSAKDMRNYQVKDILPEQYYFDDNYLDNSYIGAKYYPSIVIYDKNGNEVKSWKNNDFILPTGYKEGKELTWDFTGEEYYLKPGYSMEIKFSTRVKYAGTYGAFLNTTQLITNSDFEKENIENGVIVSDNTIEDTSYANIYSYMTTSYKEIEYDPELYNANYKQPDFDTGISIKDNNGVLDNYVQGHQGEPVKYTLNITNESKVNIKDLVVIDRLPYVGDIGVIAKYTRDSAFEVKWDSFIKAEIYDKNGQYSRTISNDKIEIAFSNERNAVFEYGVRDWLGENDIAEWSNKPDEQTTNIRFLIDYNKNDNTTYLQPGETLKITFYAIVPNYVENTGENNIAWNNFAYGYKAYNSATDTELSDLSIAEPAKVGVWVEEQKNINPGAITINKTYSANSGSTTAYFVLYKYNDNYDSEDVNSKEYEKYSSVISISVDAGETNSYTFENLPSETMYKIYETDKDGNILNANNNNWYMIEGQGAVVELNGGEDKEVNIINTALPEFKGSIKIIKNVEKYSGETVTGGIYKFVIKDELGNYVYAKNGDINKSKIFIPDVLIPVTAGKSTVIDGLDIGKYKVYEVNEDGTNVNSVENIGYTVSFSPSNSVEISRANGNQEIIATNRLEKEPEKVEVKGSKTWEDADNQDGVRPEEITINLFADGEKVESKTVTKESDWKWSFKNLDKYADGKEIEYTITEDKVEGYTSEVNGYNITNTHITEKVEVKGSKTWEDAENQDGKRPESIIINLFADGTKVESKTITKEDEWKWSFENLDKYKNGKEIKYTITEDKVEGYTSEVKGYDVTNTHIIEKVEVKGSKTWEDAENQDGVRPESITINLFANGTKIESKTITKEDEWKWSFENLDKYENGKEIKYTITENIVEGYTSEVNGYDVINTRTPGETGRTVQKIWNDNNNQDGIRPERINVQLYANGQEYGEPVELNAENGWKYTWTGLPEKNRGKSIRYSVEEIEEIPGYTTKYSIDTFIITNTHITEKVEVKGSKTWEDAENQDGIRPESITINLFANGTKIESKTVTKEDEWKWSFENLDKYANGKEIEYTITEDEIEGYTSEVNGYDVTNKHIVNIDIKEPEIPDEQPEKEQPQTPDENTNNEIKENEVSEKEIQYNVKTGDNIYISFMLLIVAVVIEIIMRKFKYKER